MKRRDYYEKLKEIVSEGYDNYRAKFEKYDALRVAREKGEYSYEYLSKEVIPKMDQLRREMREIQEGVRREVGRLTADRIEVLRFFDIIKPEELTADAELLSGGLILKEKDVQAIIDRNQGNRTMTQLAMRYADQHKMRVYSTYVGAEALKSSYKNVDNAVGMVVKWYDSPGAYKNMYDTVMGPGSALEVFCNVDTEE